MPLTNNTKIITINSETDASMFEKAEAEHSYDALSTLFLNALMIGCLLLAYYVKKHQIYHLPESAGALIVGVVVGGIVRLTTGRLELFAFSPEVFFFILLPPIIFEAGYSLKRKDFFANIGAITLYAALGTMISTFVVGGLTFYAARLGLIRNVSQENPMEALLFGALISAVDPVATLSIMGNADLGVDPLLYSLVFGESVLNDAIAIGLFKVFEKYYDPEGPDWRESEIPAALLQFTFISLLSIVVGVSLGLLCSFCYRHTHIQEYPHLETSLLFSFCYLCYATAESVSLSGIMALFFQGVVLSHYNAYNLSETAHVASEHIFATMSTLAETAVFLYMGMGVFTGRFHNYDLLFSVLALFFCLVARFLNIFPLSWVANLCRTRQNKISLEMQAVLWFAGLRGAIAFALAMNMPGENREVYATATLTICIFTTVICGGLTEGILTTFGMKEERTRSAVDGSDRDEEEEELVLNRISFNGPVRNEAERDSVGVRMTKQARKHVYTGVKKYWKRLDNDVLRPYFGGPDTQTSMHRNLDARGQYSIQRQIAEDDEVEYNGAMGFNDEPALELSSKPSLRRSTHM